MLANCSPQNRVLSKPFSLTRLAQRLGKTRAQFSLFTHAMKYFRKCSEECINILSKWLWLVYCALPKYQLEQLSALTLAISRNQSTIYKVKCLFAVGFSWLHVNFSGAHITAVVLQGLFLSFYRKLNSRKIVRKKKKAYLSQSTFVLHLSCL